jgi:putative DNA primase/helicase
MVALVTDVADKPVAIHRTYLSPSGRGKAPVDPPRMALGPIAGNAIRLSPVGEELFVGEGIETAMSAVVAGRAAWSAVSAMGLRALVLPDEVRKVGVLVDSDDDGACERAANEAGCRWLREGRQVLLHRAPPGQDFNDVLMGKAS